MKCGDCPELDYSHFPEDERPKQRKICCIDQATIREAERQAALREQAMKRQAAATGTTTPNRAQKRRAAKLERQRRG